MDGCGAQNQGREKAEKEMFKRDLVKGTFDH